MTRYAKETSVSPEKSRAEIEATLKRYGATAFMYGTNAERALVAFEARNRRLKFMLPMPDPKAKEIRLDKRGWARSDTAQRAAYEQACRQRWRALALAIKAKLEAVESGIATFEEEFLAYIVLPSGETVAQATLPRIAVAYEQGDVTPLLEHL